MYVCMYSYVYRCMFVCIHICAGVCMHRQPEVDIGSFSIVSPPFFLFICCYVQFVSKMHVCGHTQLCVCRGQRITLWNPFFSSILGFRDPTQLPDLYSKGLYYYYVFFFLKVGSLYEAPAGLRLTM